MRARLLAYSVLLLFAGIAVTVLTLRQILLTGLDSRVEDALVQEAREFRSLADGIDPRTGEPFGPRLEPLFDLFSERNVPTKDEALIYITGDEVYREEQTAGNDYRIGSRPELVRRWSRLRGPESGELQTPAGPVRYLAVPVALAGREEGGAFVVASFTAGERDEISDAVLAAAGTGAVVLLLGSIAAYLAAGRVLAPLRDLTETARSIEESDLTRRIEIRGEDELAELGRTFNAMLARLDTAFSSQRELLRDVSHELRTPITIARGHLELMSDDPAERVETVELVTDELDRMARLVEDLVVLARAERPDFLRTERLEVGGFVREVLAKTVLLGDREWVVSVGEDGFLVADPQRLTQALINLADNAVRQTEPGGRIEIGADVSGGRVRLWVADDGPGIEEDDRERLFERFARGARGERYAGTGLGLAIVRAVAEAHGGSVRLSSEPGSGARFELDLPAGLQGQRGSTGAGAT